MGDQDTIKVGLHGYIMPDYSPKWKQILAYASGENTVRIVFDACRVSDLGPYTITDDEYERTNQKTRFQQVKESAQVLSQDLSYRFGDLGDKAFLIEHEEYKLILLAGQRLRVKDISLSTKIPREYELLTFGRDGIDDRDLLDDTFESLEGEGLPAIGEHLLAYGHQGPMEHERIFQYCTDGRFTAVEHNAKIAMPNAAWLIPQIHSALLPLRGARKSANIRLEKLIKTIKNPFIDNGSSFPVIANDDSDFPEHIGAAYTEFLRDQIRLDTNGDNITEDLMRLITNNQFRVHKGHLTFPQIMKYAYLIKTN